MPWLWLEFFNKPYLLFIVFLLKSHKVDTFKKHCRCVWTSLSNKSLSLNLNSMWRSFFSNDRPLVLLCLFYNNLSMKTWNSRVFQSLSLSLAWETIPLLLPCQSLIVLLFSSNLNNNKKSLCLFILQISSRLGWSAWNHNHVNDWRSKDRRKPNWNSSWKPLQLRTQ